MPDSAGPEGAKKRSRFNFFSSPWIIAVFAPVLAAVVLGLIHLIQSSIENSAQPLISATATYNGHYTWTISSPFAVDASALNGKVTGCDSMRKWLLDQGGSDLSVT